MSNADMIFTVVLVITYVFCVSPLIGSSFIGRFAKYKESLLVGLTVTVCLALFVAVLFIVVSAVLYFSGEVKTDSPMYDFINWVNNL